MITESGSVDCKAAVLCCWKHLVEVSSLFSGCDSGAGGVGGGLMCSSTFLQWGCMCTHARHFKRVSVCLFPSYQSLSVQAILGGGGVCGGGVIGQGAPAARSRPTLQQILQLSGNAAGESCVDPRVGARVQTGQQHQDSEGHSLVWWVGVPRCPKLDDEER